VAEFSGRPIPVGRVGIVVSRYNQVITSKLLDGAQQCCRDSGVPEGEVDVIWAPGAFELTVCCAAAAATGRYACLVALGAIIRGGTPHFEYVAGATSHGLVAVSVEYRVPVGFGVLTVDSMAQATARAGGQAGNKGYEAADAAIRSADVISRLRSTDAEA